ncbi:MAG: hypothetical protein BWK78_09515 [Thiotrichaceae bacterium IS1]|nr:MAG: hypothetical protein BWK78_09515 [Thiotrichaceae bacterium IS1]
MIEIYFAKLEEVLPDFPTIQSYTLTKKVYNTNLGFISGSVMFENSHRLDFVEVKDVTVGAKIKYRYQYMNDHHQLIFRYDNAPHHPLLLTFPHHKHLANDKVAECSEPTLVEVLLECVNHGKTA